METETVTVRPIFRRWAEELKEAGFTKEQATVILNIAKDCWNLAMTAKKNR